MLRSNAARTAATVAAAATGRRAAAVRAAATAAVRFTAPADAAAVPGRRSMHWTARNHAAATTPTAAATAVAAPVSPVSEVFQQPPDMIAAARIKGHEEYLKLHKRSLEDNDEFWREMALESVTWSTPFTDVKIEGPYGTPDTRWFVGGKLNASFNAVDRHVLAGRGDKTAIIWEADDGVNSRKISFRELQTEVSRAANALKALGVKKGDTVALYMPMIPETVFAMLACARIGAPHNAIFAGFSAEGIAERIRSSSAKVVITADEMYRAGKKLPLKPVVDQALAKGCDTVTNVVVVQRTGANVPMTPKRDVLWSTVVGAASTDCPPVAMNSQDPLFTLFTSGSTGKPKGLVHTTGGYLTYAATTFRYAFDIKDNDVFACMADIGWVGNHSTARITGHSYGVYGSLTNGTTSLIFEGHPTFPHTGRYWELVSKHRISIFYVSPTAIRALMALGEAPIKPWNLSSLRILGTVGENIGVEAWKWYHREVGGGKRPIIDTYWQTETGGIILSPIMGATPLKPGAAAMPFLGIDLGLYTDEGDEILPGSRTGPGGMQEASGLLCIKRPWPGLASTILGDHERYLNVYFNHWSRHRDLYITGDGARRDADGFYFINGRVDDVINVSGHRIGSAEVESAIVQFPQAAEAAVIGMPHAIKGEALVAFVVAKEAAAKTLDERAFVAEVRAKVAAEIGKLAIPDVIFVVHALPKTRSGKIMRRLLRNIVTGKTDAKSLGDTSTLADASVIDGLIKQVQSQLPKQAGAIHL